MKQKCMKWIVYVLLFSFVLAAFAACGTEAGTDETQEPTGTQTEAPTETPTEAPTDGGDQPDQPDPPKPPEPPVYYNGTPDTSWYDPDHVVNEYTLDSAEALMGFFELRKATTFDGKTIRLAKNVVINEGTVEEILDRVKKEETVYEWTPLNSSWIFRGIFDGQGHTISGVYLQGGISGYRGMFGVLAGDARIRNLNVEHLYVSGPTAPGKKAMGGLIAGVHEEMSNVAVANVRITDALICDGVDKNGTPTLIDQVGGFVGTIGEKCAVTLTNCAIQGTIDIGGTCAGGFVGYMNGSLANVEFYKCDADVTVKAAQYAGGLGGSLTGRCAIDIDTTVKATIQCDQDGGEKYGLVDEVYSKTFAPMEAPAEGTDSLRVMSFNIQGNLGGDGGTANNFGKNRIEAVTAEILANEPMLIGLQEDKALWDSSLMSRLTDYTLFCDFTISDSVERNAVLYRKDLKVIDRGFCWLTADGTGDTVALTIKDLTTEGSPYYMSDEELAMLFLSKDSPDSDLKKSQTQYYDRDTNVLSSGAVGAYLTTRRMTYIVLDVNGQAVIFANTHLTHRSQYSRWYRTEYAKLRSNERIREYEILNQKLDTVREKYPDALTIIVGDHNDEVTQPIYQYATSMYDDAAARANVFVGGGNNPSANVSWNNAFVLASQGSEFPHARETVNAGRIDYCFISKEGFTVTRFKVGNGRGTFTREDGTRATYYTSDHLPLIIDLNFQTTGGSLGEAIKENEEGDGSTSYFKGIADTAWFTGDKTEYELTTAAQLVGFMALRSDEQTFDGITIKLGCDMIINDKTAAELKEGKGVGVFKWRELNSNYLFKGTLDGQGHTVSGIYFKASAGLKALLGCADGNVCVRNLNLRNLYICGPDKTGKNTLGVLFGRVNNKARMVISDVHIEGIVEEGKANDFEKVGGFIGEIRNGATLKMENCSFSGSISVKGSFVGGLIACCGLDNINMVNCHNKADLSGRDYINGLIGYIQYPSSKVNLVDCTNTGKLTATGVCSGEIYYQVKPAKV